MLATTLIRIVMAAVLTTALNSTLSAITDAQSTAWIQREVSDENGVVGARVENSFK